MVYKDFLVFFLSAVQIRYNKHLNDILLFTTINMQSFWGGHIWILFFFIINKLCITGSLDVLRKTAPIRLSPVSSFTLMLTHIYLGIYRHKRVYNYPTRRVCRTLLGNVFIFQKARLDENKLIKFLCYVNRGI